MPRFIKLATTLGLASALLAYYAIGQQPPALNAVSNDEASVLMRAKLSSSQRVIEGLMSADFEMIRKGGEDLQKICDSNQWRQRDEQVVAHYRGELRRSALKLIALAKEENLDGAAYTYMHTMTTCINCHQYSRDVLRIADRSAPLPQVVRIPVTEQENSAREFRNLYR